MSTAALGASRVGAVMSTLFEHGYRCARVSASGQRKGGRRDEQCLAGDIIALTQRTHAMPHLLVEVGGSGKRLGVAFAELRESLMPGFAPLIVRFVDRKRYYYVSEDDRFTDISDALQALKEA